MEDFKRSYSFQQFVKCFLVSKWPLLNLHLFRKISASWGEMDILEHIYRQFLRKTCFLQFYTFHGDLWITTIFQVFRWGEDACNLNSLWYSKFPYEMHGHLDFLERLILPSSGFTLVEVAVRNKIKQRKWRGNVLPS